MKEQIISGWLAIASVLLSALVLIAGGGRDGEPSALMEQYVQAGAPALEIRRQPEKELREVRTVQAIVVHQAPEPESYDEGVMLTVRIDGAEREMRLSDYLCGVLMGEMPAEFPLEALKAQAVAARTYTLRRMETGGVLSDDPAECQAYCDPATAEQKYGEDAAVYITKMRRAVAETDGQVMTYDGTLITATYFSCSGGRTESAQAVWGSSVPYLLSVDSPGEESAGSYESVVTVDKQEMMDALEISDLSVQSVTYTDGGGVDAMVIGGKAFSGVELRRVFGLRSTCFTLEIGEDTATFSVKGYGHRVGLSQYGAKAMAEAGSDYLAILTWYYSGAQLSEAI